MKKRLLVYILLPIFLLGLFACGDTAGDSIKPVKKAGTVILSVNPSVKLNYDTNGLIMDIIGLNEDGSILAASKDELLGVPCPVAIYALILNINDAGFFTSDLGEEEKEIFLVLGKDSIYHKGFLKALEQAICEAAEECGLESVRLTTIKEENKKIEEDMPLYQRYLPETKERLPDFFR